MGDGSNFDRRSKFVSGGSGFQFRFKHRCDHERHDNAGDHAIDDDPDGRSYDCESVDMSGMQNAAPT